MPTSDLQGRATKVAKPYKGIGMEGPIAKWYVNVRKPDEEMDDVVHEVHDSVPAGSRILEVAPGPGDLAIALAKSGQYSVVGLDISKTFIDIARAKAREAGVAVDFRYGNASDMPFEANTFDYLVCRAAFKNFTQPVEAIREMYRVLKPGGAAVIFDLRGDATPEDISKHVESMGLSRINHWMTKLTFKHILLKNAYRVDQIRKLVAQTKFGTADIRENEIGMEIRLKK